MPQLRNVLKNAVVKRDLVLEVALLQLSRCYRVNRKVSFVQMCLDLHLGARNVSAYRASEV